MTDKVQKIREEVARLKLCTMDEHMKFYSECAEAEYNALCKVEEIIDSLQEEPVSKQIDFEKELYKAFGQVKDFTLGMRIAKHFYELGHKEEPVSEELEIAKRQIASSYMDELEKELGRKDYAYWNGLEKGIELGAQWQKERLIAWLTREADYLIQELKKGNKAYGLSEQYRAQLYKEIVNKLNED